MTAFSELGLAEPVLRAVQAAGYENPTPIQAAVIPAILSDRDVLGIAQTGTGKTAAFTLPLLHGILADRARPRPKRCRTLILAPTRELADQIAHSIRAYGRFMRLSLTVVVGGAKPGPQIRALGRGIDILVATPGRLMDHMRAGHAVLDDTRTVVLDEADQMMDLGFLPAIRTILGALAQDRRTVLLSATMPGQIRGLAQDFLTDPAEISVAPSARPIARIDQHVRHVARAEKRAALVGLLRGEADVGIGAIARAIVFTRTKRGADRVADHLARADLAAAAIHGDKSQSQRRRALEDFRKGRVDILVATDVAARGIDIDDVGHVINFELPDVAESYVHRIGRTARAGRSGVAISLVEPEEYGLLRQIARLTGTDSLLENVPAHHGGDAKGGDRTRRRFTKPRGHGPRKPAGARRRSGTPGRDGGRRRAS